MSIDLEAIEARAKAATTVVFIGVPMRKENSEFFEHAKDDVDALLAEVERLNAGLQAENTQVKPDGKCREDDGCPTENAVLQREWRKLTEQLAAVTAERDAAVKDINLLEDCGVCKHHDCDDCDLAGTECRFEWRGARKEQNDGK